MDVKTGEPELQNVALVNKVFKVSPSLIWLDTKGNMAL
jgi:hypothetical protein